jgi:hypothetical protein
MTDVLELDEPVVAEDKWRVVVRVTTTYFKTKRGLATRKDVTYLRRKSCGHNFLDDDATMAGPDNAIKQIVNLDTVKDGIYKVIITNISTDWETGYVDDYDFLLVPFEESKPTRTCKPVAVAA